MFKRCMVYLSLIVMVIVSIGPFIWLLSTAMKSSHENIFQYPPQLFPEAPTLGNFTEVWTAVPMMMYFINSLVMTILAVIFNLVFSVLAAYPLARLDFKGKNSIFLVVLA